MRSPLRRNARVVHAPMRATQLPRIRKRIVIAALLLVLMQVIGTLGFYLEADETVTLSDAMHMSLITITTVGYGDVVPHGDGRLIGSIEAVIGTLMTGLSTAWLLAFVSRALVSKSPA